MPSISTVLVKRADNHVCLVNLSDFDPDTMKIVTKAEEPKPEKKIEEPKLEWPFNPSKASFVILEIKKLDLKTLNEVEELERSGKARKGIMAAIATRRAALTPDDDEE
jgi:hypothetical protein